MRCARCTRASTCPTCPLASASWGRAPSAARSSSSCGSSARSSRPRWGGWGHGVRGRCVWGGEGGRALRCYIRPLLGKRPQLTDEALHGVVARCGLCVSQCALPLPPRPRSPPPPPLTAPPVTRPPPAAIAAPPPSAAIAAAVWHRPARAGHCQQPAHDPAGDGHRPRQLEAGVRGEGGWAGGWEGLRRGAGACVRVCACRYDGRPA